MSCMYDEYPFRTFNWIAYLQSSWAIGPLSHDPRLNPATGIVYWFWDRAKLGFQGFWCNRSYY